MTEYPIWGAPPGQKDETLLYVATSMDSAREVVKILETVHGCTDCRVQTLNLKEDPRSALRMFRDAVNK
jgi:hypothetical protein